MAWHRLFIFFLLFIAKAWCEDPSILYLSWKDDPARTMTVIWHEKDAEKVYYKPVSASEWQSEKGKVVPLDHLAIHQVELKGLEPNTLYEFRIEEGPIHKFKTLPAKLDHPLKIAIGGDAYYTPETNSEMNREVASRNPEFVIMAGDIAYAEGIKCALRSRAWKIGRWQKFFKAWSDDMVTTDGRMIPIVPALGNHDVREGFDSPHREQVIFYRFFVFPHAGVPYQLFKVGQQLCFYLLDSGHSLPIGGAQAEWLEKNLKENRQAPFHIPVYHIAAYPSETSYTHRGAKDIRKFWVPLFEKYGVKVCMEHDNHTFKRTFPIRGGKVDPSGIYYLGDGAWGVPAQKPHRHWYLEKAIKTNCYWLLTATPSECQFQAYNLKGELIDEIKIQPQTSTEQD